jgi:hypothetical protein
VWFNTCCAADCHVDVVISRRDLMELAIAHTLEFFMDLWLLRFPLVEEILTLIVLYSVEL